MAHDALDIHVKSLPKERIRSSPPFWMSLSALGASLGYVIFTLLYNLSSSTAEPLSISSNSIVRGLGSFPSDELGELVGELGCGELGPDHDRCLN